MTETHTLNRMIQIKRKYGPNFGDVFFSWFFYGLFRMAFYRFLFPWSFFGIALNYILLLSAISVTFRAFISPRTVYSIETEVGPEEPSIIHETPHDSPRTSPQEKPETEIKEKPKKEEIKTTLQQKRVESESQTPNVMYCSYCGVENSSQARYCATCGNRIQ